MTDTNDHAEPLTDEEVAALRNGPDRSRWEAWAFDAELQWLRRCLKLAQLTEGENLRAELYERYVERRRADRSKPALAQ